VEQEIRGFFEATLGRVPRPQQLTPETLRYMAERSKTFSAILYRRSQQIARFARRPLFDGDTGFEVVPKEKRHTPTEAERAEARRIEDILLNTGAVYNPLRRDNLRTAMQKMLYDTLVYDAIVVEPVKNEQGQLIEWWVLDGGSIYMVDPSIYTPRTEIGKLVSPIHYVQVQHEQVLAEWNASELIYVIRNPSPQLDRSSYGQPELELLVDVVTIEIEVLTWAKMVLMNSSVPDGLIILESNRPSGDEFTAAPFGSNQSIEDLRRQWRNEISGARNAGRMAVFQVPHGDKATFYEAATKDRDMPFQSLYELAQNIICAYLGVSPAELGVVEGSMKSGSFIDSDARASQLRYSRLNGLVYLLETLKEPLDKLVEMINPEFCVQFRGIDHTAEEERHNLEAAMIDSGRITYNDLRRMANLPEYEGWWADIPANPTILQIEAAARGINLRGGGVGQPTGVKRAKPGVSGQPNTRVPGRDAEPGPWTPKDGIRREMRYNEAKRERASK
jgi:hypothetical protein